MSDLTELLTDSTRDVEAHFTVDDIRLRAMSRRRLRLVVSVLAVLVLVGTTGLALRASGTDSSSNLATASPSPWQGRWIAIAFSGFAEGQGPTGRAVEIRLEPDGVLGGFDGCGEITGRWDATDGDRLVVVDYQVPADAFSSCSVGSRTAAKVLRAVLTGSRLGATMQPFEQLPDSLRLGVGDTFVGFVRDVSYGTDTDPAKSGESIDVPGYDVIADSSATAPSADPKQTRSIRLASTDGATVISIARDLGGMPLNPRALVLGTVGAIAKEVDVASHRGVLVSDSTGAALALSWTPADDITLTLRAPSLSDAEAIGLADRIRYRRGHLDVSALKTGRTMSRSDANAVTTPAQVAATGEVDGVFWRVLVYGTPSGTCVELETGIGAMADCGTQEPVEARLAQVVGRPVIRGATPEVAVAVRLEWDGGSTEVPAIALARFPGRRYFAANVPPDVRIRRVTALGPRNEEVAATEDISIGGAVGGGK